jgi:hypothetical protein
VCSLRVGLGFFVLVGLGSRGFVFCLFFLMLLNKLAWILLLIAQLIDKRITSDLKLCKCVMSTSVTIAKANRGR